MSPRQTRGHVTRSISPAQITIFQLRDAKSGATHELDLALLMGILTSQRAQPAGEVSLEACVLLSWQLQTARPLSSVEQCIEYKAFACMPVCGDARACVWWRTWLMPRTRAADRSPQRMGGAHSGALPARAVAAAPQHGLQPRGRGAHLLR